VPADVRAVLLDGLGTLLALERPWPELVARLHEEHGLELSPDDAERAFRAEMTYYRAHHHEGRDADTLADLRRRCAMVLERELPAAIGEALSPAQLTTAMLDALRFSAYADAPAALAALRARGCTLVVVSNWDISLPAVLSAAGLAELLDGVITSAAIGTPKPAPAIFEAALELAGVSPQKAVHVGDTLAHDVLGARDAGIAPVLLRRADAGPASSPSRAAADPPEAGTHEGRLAGVPVISSLAELLA
jgi:putative hydrolase of the HAD superfamily